MENGIFETSPQCVQDLGPDTEAGLNPFGSGEEGQPQQIVMALPVGMMGGRENGDAHSLSGVLERLVELPESIKGDLKISLIMAGADHAMELDTLKRMGQMGRVRDMLQIDLGSEDIPALVRNVLGREDNAPYRSAIQSARLTATGQLLDASTVAAQLMRFGTPDLAEGALTLLEQRGATIGNLGEDEELNALTNGGIFSSEKLERLMRANDASRRLAQASFERMCGVVDDFEAENARLARTHERVLGFNNSAESRQIEAEI